MDKIPFVDGTKIKNATVTVNEQEYEVTPAQYSGTTPVSAFNLNKMQNNIENTLVKVSATEPNPKADVWIKHGDDVEDDILVNDNGVYNSVLNRKNAISLGIKEQVNITQQGLRILVPMDNLSVKVGETFELLSDGTIKILKNTIIFAFAQTQLIINDTDTGRLYIEKNGDGICAEEGKGTKAYQAMGIFNVNVGDIIRVTVVNVTAGRGNTGTTVSFNHLDMYEI